MFSTRTSLITITIAGAMFATASAAQAASTTLATEQAPTRVAAWEGTVMWSHFDAATATYSLMKSVGGAPPAPVGVAPRAGAPFDIDLGTDATGAAFAVYTRAGDIYRLNVSTGREAKVAKLGSPQIERDPTIQQGAIAFIRRSGGYDQLRIASAATGAKGSRLIVKRRAIVSAELGDGRVAYVESQTREGVQSVHVRNLRSGADRSVYRAVSGGSNYARVTKPTYAAAPAAFVWARTNLGSGSGNRLIRYTVGDSKLAYAPGSVRYNTTAWVSEALGAVTAGSLDGSETPGACTDGIGAAAADYCNVVLSGPLQFSLNP